MIRYGAWQTATTSASDASAPEAREILVRVHGGLPHARALREDLERAAAELRRPPDRLVDAAGARDVGSEQHGRSLSARRRDRRGAGSRLQSSPVASPVRTRFAPSPTGLLHVGGVRTALFSWLYARHNGGRFVLRIEDTDETREHPEAIEQIQRSLRWVGLEWDEGPGVGGDYGPYVQSERRPRHHEVAEQFLGGGPRVPLLLHDRGARGRARGRPARGPAVHLLAPLPRAERGGARGARGRGRPVGHPAAHARRPGECVVNDLVRGAVRFEYAQLGDHVIVRSDGVPTYNFANPIDDADMRITHVIRGEDLLSSTPRQVLVHEALRSPVPAFAHLPLLFGPDRKRLSKRHGATSVEELREDGYLAEAVVNFLALLGWHFDSERELFTLSELIGLFSLERVNPAPAVFDAKKLEWMNGVYLRALPTFDLAERLTVFLRERGSPLAVAARPDRRGDASGAGEDRHAGRVRAALRVPVRPDRDRSGGLGQGRRARARRRDPRRGADGAREDRDWGVDAIEAALRGVCEELSLKPRAVFGLVRVAVTGTSISPGLFESVHALGRDETLTRLATAAARL